MSDPQHKNWAHSALLLMDEVDALIRFGCANAPAEKYETAAKAFWRVSHMLAAERARLEQAPAVEADGLDAKRYRKLRRGQRWSVIDGIGNTLRADELDAAIDAALAASKEKKE